MFSKAKRSTLLQSKIEPSKVSELIHFKTILSLENLIIMEELSSIGHLLSKGIMFCSMRSMKCQINIHSLNYRKHSTCQINMETPLLISLVSTMKEAKLLKEVTLLGCSFNMGHLQLLKTTELCGLQCIGQLDTATQKY